jgi:hypothetical protein
MERASVVEVSSGRSQPAILVLGVLLAGLSVPAAASADGPELGKYAGNYQFKGKKEDGEKTVDKAVDEALADLSMVMRLMVKKAMDARKTPFIETIAIETPPGKIAITMGDMDRVETKANQSETVKRDGRTGKVTHKFGAGKLTQIVEGENGVIQNVLTLTSDGKTLHRDVTITNERLKKPIKYRLTYARK